MKKSFYTLEIFVRPGGSRMSWLFIADNSNSLKKILDYYFIQDGENLSLYHLLCYGTSIIVQTYQEGKRIQQINLNPFIEVEIEGFERLSIASFETEDIDGSLIYQMQEKGVDHIIQFEVSDFEDILFQSYNNSENWTWKVFIDWDKVGLEKLNEPIIGKFDKVEVEENYRKRTTMRFLGLHNTERGGYSNQLNWSNLFSLKYKDQEYYEIELTWEPDFCANFINPVADVLNSNNFGFTVFSSQESSEVGHRSKVFIANQQIGDQTVDLIYDLQKKEYQLDCSFFYIKVEISESFFKHFSDHYAHPALTIFEEYGNYTSWKIKEEMPRLRIQGGLGKPKQLQSSEIKKIQYSLGTGEWEKMIALENKIMESNTVFAHPVALATSENSIQKEISQFYTLYSASLISIRRISSDSGPQLFLDCEYKPDNENYRNTIKYFYQFNIDKKDLPSDLYSCLNSIEEFIIL